MRLPRRLALIAAGSALLLVSVVPAAAGRAPATARYANTVEHKTALDAGRIRVADAARNAIAHPRKPHQPLARLSVRTTRRNTAERVPSVPNLSLGTKTSSMQPRIVAAPDPAAATSFDGIRSSDESDLIEPPDPWIAVNGTHVIQAVNSLVRISTRSGTELQTLPTWALFGLSPDQQDSDPRIVWDAFHGRWVGVLTSFNYPLFTDNHLNLIVSATADPLGTWDRYTFDYGPNLADYPGLASSTDRIVLTSDDFSDFGSGLEFWRESIVVIPWSAILAGGSVGYSYFPNTSRSYTHARPAQVLSASASVHVIMEYDDGVDLSAYYLVIAGSATSPTIPVEDNLTSDLGIAPFTTPIDPRNSDGSTIAAALDERPTDAVWRNGRLWWASTYSFDAGGSVFYDAARATSVLTTASTPTSPVDLGFEFPGYDTYMPGVGVTGNDTVIVPMTASSDATNIDPSTIAFRWNSTDGVNGSSEFFDLGDGPYTGSRWGDYLGVATDPSGTGAVWVADEVAAGGGTWRTTVLRLAVDATAPTVTAPSMSVLSISSLTATVPVKLSWSGADAESGVAKYKLEQNVDGVGWELITSSTLSTSVTRALLAGHSYQFRVTATNGVGIDSLPAASSKFEPFLYQQTASNVSYSGSWTAVTSSSYSGGSARYASVAGRSATVTVTNARSIAFVSTKATSRGSFKVYIDGVLKKTISPHATSTKYRQILYQYSWSTSGTHKMKIVVVGTAGHPRVDVDAFVALKVVP